MFLSMAIFLQTMELASLSLYMKSLMPPTLLTPSDKVHNSGLEMCMSFVISDRLLIVIASTKFHLQIYAK